MTSSNFKSASLTNGNVHPLPRNWPGSSTVRDRMAQKMDFLAEDLSDLREPTAEELRAWFEQNSRQFALPARVTFRHLYISPDRRGQRAHDDAIRALNRLAHTSAD